MSQQSPAPPARATKLYSCQLCTRRKVKCDKQQPCSYCIKCREPCVQPNLSAPRPRKKRFAEAELLARLRRYEVALKGYGANLENINKELASERLAGVPIKHSDTLTPSPGSGPDYSPHDGDTKWPSAHDELRQEQDYLRGDDSDELDETPITSTWDRMFEDDGSSLLFGAAPTNVDLVSLHPEPVHVFSLWQAFIENVNPLMKIVHVPTLQQQMLKASSSLDTTTPAMHALMFGVYSMAITSQDDQTCQATYGHDKLYMATRFHMGSQLALRQAQVLRSTDMMVLQALVLHLNAIRSHVDPRSLFCFSGIAERIARRNSLHRAGRIRGVSVFDAEMRKRLWWQIMLLEMRMAQLSGAGHAVLSSLWDANLPLNVNDSDLHPGMTVEPREHQGATEMIFCLPRYECIEFLRQIRQAVGLNVGFHEFSSPKVSVPDVARAIDELEQRVSDKYLKYCDEQIPMHHIAMGTARFAINQMRYHLHSSGFILGQGSSLSDNEKDYLFELALDMLETHNKMQLNPSLERFNWFLLFNKPFVACIHILFNLRFRSTGPIVDRAWHEISHMMKDFRNKQFQISFAPRGLNQSPLQLAIANLLVKAWEVREQALRQKAPVPTPPLILEMREKLAAHKSANNTPRSTTTNEVPTPLPHSYNISDSTMVMSNQFDQQQAQPFTGGGFADMLGIGNGIVGQLTFDESKPWEFWNTFLPGGSSLGMVDDTAWGVQEAQGMYQPSAFF